MVLLSALWAHEAAADFITLVASGSVAHDTNVFKRPDPIPDSVRTGSLGLRIDKAYSQQRFQLDATGSAYRHQDNPELDFDGLDYHATWLWSLTSRITGSLYTDRSEGQVPFIDFQRTVQNVRVSTTRGVNADGLVGHGLHLIAGASRAEQHSTTLFLAQPDFRVDYVQAGVKYVPSAGNSLSFVKRTGNGLYTKREFDPLVPLDTSYKQNETEIRAEWLPSGRSNLLFRLTQFERRHEHLSQLDSSGNGGELTFGWNATGKLSVTLSGKRDFVPFFDVQTTHRVDKSLTVTPRWQVSPQIAYTLALQRIHSDFLGNLTTTTGDTREDTYSVADLGVFWALTRNLTINAVVQRQRRSSNEPTAVFDATINRISATLTF